MEIREQHGRTKNVYIVKHEDTRKNVSNIIGSFTSRH